MELFGRRLPADAAVVRRCLAEEGAENEARIRVVNAEEIVTMEDDPATACRRKKDSSMTVALTMLKNGEGDAAVSAGSTGALLTGATLIVKRVKGILGSTLCLGNTSWRSQSQALRSAGERSRVRGITGWALSKSSCTSLSEGPRCCGCGGFACGFSSFCWLLFVQKMKATM